MRTQIDHRLKKLEQQETNLARARIKAFILSAMTEQEHRAWRMEMTNRLVAERGEGAMHALKYSSGPLTRPAADRLIEHLRLWIDSYRDGSSVAERWEKSIGPIEAKPVNQ